MLISLKKETLLNNFYTCLISLKKKSLQKCISAQNFDSSCLSSKIPSLESSHPKTLAQRGTQAGCLAPTKSPSQATSVPSCCPFPELLFQQPWGMFFLLKDQPHQGSPKEGRVPQVVDEVNQSHMACRPPVAIRLCRGRRSCKACFMREPGGAWPQGLGF